MKSQDASWMSRINSFTALFRFPVISLNFLIGSNQLFKPHRIQRTLGKKTVGSILEGSLPIFWHIVACENENDNIWMSCFNLLGEFQATFPGNWISMKMRSGTKESTFCKALSPSTASSMVIVGKHPFRVALRVCRKKSLSSTIKNLNFSIAHGLGFQWRQFSP